MAFDATKFKKATFQHRTNDVSVDGLGMFGDKEGKATFTVRGLTALELAQVGESVQKSKDASELSPTSKTEKAVEAVSELLNIDDSPDDHIQKISLLSLGLVEPFMKRKDVVKFSSVFPVQFNLLAAEVANLTGLGMDVKKP